MWRREINPKSVVPHPTEFKSSHEEKKPIYRYLFTNIMDYCFQLVLMHVPSIHSESRGRK